MTAPSVSVIIPTHNRPGELRRAVRSVVAQTVGDIEVLVVDDGSREPVRWTESDGADDRVRVVRFEQAQGVAAARNAAIRVARGEWVAFLDDDDLWAPDKLAQQLAVAATEDAGFIYTSTIMVSEEGRVVARLPATSPEDLTRRLLSQNVIGGPSAVMVRRDALIRAGAFDPELAIIADWDMWIRLSQVARPAAVTDVTTAVLVHAGNMQTTQVTEIRAELQLMEQRHAHLLDPGQHIGSLWTELWIAEREWTAKRSIRSTAVYAYRYLRRPQALRALRRAVGRHVAPSLAPPWVLEALAR